MSSGRILPKVAEYYTGKIHQYGPTPQGADWNSETSQILRFEVLMRMANTSLAFSVIDYGCGYGALIDYLQTRQLSFQYTGFDLSAAMIAQAEKSHRGKPLCRFVAEEAHLTPADYTVASGIFNVRLDTPEKEWTDYMIHTLGKMAQVSTQGLGFNVLSIYSHPERRRPDLYYADPLYWFHYCKKNLSPFVTLFHDYPLYEFTLWVKK
jgi:SAM-dependent methyltransferase